MKIERAVREQPSNRRGRRRRLLLKKRKPGERVTTLRIWVRKGLRRSWVECGDGRGGGRSKGPFYIKDSVAWGKGKLLVRAGIELTSESNFREATIRQKLFAKKLWDTN